MLSNKVADQRRVEGLASSPEYSPEMIGDTSSPYRLDGGEMRSSDVALNQKSKIGDSKKHV